MDISTASLDLGNADYRTTSAATRATDGAAVTKPAGPPDQEALRRAAWEISERRLVDSYCPPGNHVGLAMVHPSQGFAYWRMQHGWVEELRRSRGGRWEGSRPILRLYDTSYIEFNGLN